MPSLMYLIFAKKQRIKIFDPPGGQVGLTFFHPLIILGSLSHFPHFLGLHEELVPAEMAYAYVFEFFGVF